MSEKSQTQPHNFVKVSRRDFPYVMSKKLNGGTTVAGTMIIAQKVDKDWCFFYKNSRSTHFSENRRSEYPFLLLEVLAVFIVGLSRQWM